jgi:hypothetical protein
MGMNVPDNREEELNRTLDALLAAYREASPAPEVSPDFMPRLWQQIEARRSASYSFVRWTRALVTASAALCVLLGLLQVYLPSQPIFYTQTYIEVLQEEGAAEGSTYLEALWVEDGGSSRQ